MRKSRVQRMVLATCLGSFLLVIFYFQSSLNPAFAELVPHWLCPHELCPPNISHQSQPYCSFPGDRNSGSASVE
ncbi:hypothetical protein KIL84_003795 [Mauremys mutica]|uniref:Uncharacterized protein n=1 Tax=Mauremys mutica TaxID=74926 RepID=A0A9D4AMX4_9SAUR|nr:hypothetical protein KIL84_003795 [Mauremys mutica]